MAAQQTILFTVIPRGGRTEGDTLPVSVIVSPRLGGEDRLGAYPDWVRWTRRLQEVGLGGRRRFGCGIFVPPPRREA